MFFIWPRPLNMSFRRCFFLFCSFYGVSIKRGSSVLLCQCDVSINLLLCDDWMPLVFWNWKQLICISKEQLYPLNEWMTIKRKIISYSISRLIPFFTLLFGAAITVSLSSFILNSSLLDTGCVDAFNSCTGLLTTVGGECLRTVLTIP